MKLGIGILVSGMALGALAISRLQEDESGQPNQLANILRTKDAAYLMLPPELVVGKTADPHLHWSADSKQILVATPASPENIDVKQFLLYNVLTQQRRTIKLSEMAKRTVSDVGFFAGGQSIAITVDSQLGSEPSSHGSELRVINLGTGDITRSRIQDGDLLSGLMLSGSSTYCHLLCSSVGAHPSLHLAGFSVLTFDCFGRFVSRGKLPRGATVTGEVSPTEGIEILKYDRTEPKSPTRVFGRLQPATGEIRWGTVSMENSERELPYNVVERQFEIRSGEGEPVGRYGLLREADSTISADNSRENSASRAEALIAVGISDEPSLSPDGKAVAFISQGALFVRRIQPIPLVAYEKIAKEAKKRAAMLAARQVGLSLLMYSSDNDDILPPGSDIKRMVMPYIKRESVFDTFYYTYTGGLDINAIKDPAATELGYAQGPGGRAVVYLDGHVSWIADP